MIGAPQDSPDFFREDTGAAYFFNTNGTLLHTISNPAYNEPGHFGSALAVLGTSKVLVGAEEKWGGGFAPGGAYLFDMKSLPLPALNVERTDDGNIRIRWPYPSTGFILEKSDSSLSKDWWSLVPPPYQRDFLYSNEIPYVRWSATVTPTNNVFYRLGQP